MVENCENLSTFISIIFKMMQVLLSSIFISIQVLFLVELQGGSDCPQNDASVTLHSSKQSSPASSFPYNCFSSATKGGSDCLVSSKDQQH